MDWGYSIVRQFAVPALTQHALTPFFSRLSKSTRSWRQRSQSARRAAGRRAGSRRCAPLCPNTEEVRHLGGCVMSNGLSSLYGSGRWGTPHLCPDVWTQLQSQTGVGKLQLRDGLRVLAALEWTPRLLNQEYLPIPTFSTDSEVSAEYRTMVEHLYNSDKSAWFHCIRWRNIKKMLLWLFELINQYLLYWLTHPESRDL